MVRKIVGCAVAFGLSACATQLAQRPSAAGDPAAPAATESFARQPSHTLDSVAKRDEAPAATTTFVCPMHPDVTSDKTGHCPKCGMALVPNQPVRSTP